MNTSTIKKRIWFYTAALCVSLSLIIYACYGPEIDELTTRVTDLENTVKQIKDKIEGKKFVTNVQSISNGFIITFDDGQTFNVTNGTNGENGKNGTMWQIDPTDYMWMYFDSDGKYVKTGWRAVPEDGKPGEPGKSLPSPKISVNGFWILYEWDSNGDPVEVETKIPAQMSPYTSSYNVSYLDLFIPKIDSINYTPPKVVYDSIRLPRSAEVSLTIYFRGYGQLLSGAEHNIKLLDSLSFSFWTFDTVAINREWLKSSLRKKFTDTVYIKGLPYNYKDSLVVVFATNKAIASPPLDLVDSQKNPNTFFDVAGFEKATGLLTKTKAPYSDDNYYSFLNVRRGLFPSNVKQGNYIYYLKDDTIISAAGFPIRATYNPSISAPLKTLGGKIDTVVTDLNKRYFKIDPAVLQGVAFENEDLIYDYYITDTFQPSPIIFPSLDSMKFSTAIDTPSYILVVKKLLINGEIKIDTVVISTRDTVRDLKKYPIP